MATLSSMTVRLGIDTNPLRAGAQRATTTVRNMANRMTRDTDDATTNMVRTIRNSVDDTTAAMIRDVDGRLRDARGRFVRAGDDLGTAVRDGFNRATANITRDVNGRLRDERGRFIREGQRTGGDGGDGLTRSFGQRMRSGMRQAMQDGMSGFQDLSRMIQSNPYISAAGTALGVVIGVSALPAIAAILSGAVISVGGLTVVGIAASVLKEVPEVEGAMRRLKTSMSNILKQAARPLAPALVDGLNTFRGALMKAAPDIKRIFASMQPSIKPLASAIGDAFGDAIEGFRYMMENSRPVFDGLAEMIRKIGEGLRVFFAMIGRNPQDVAQALRDLGTVFYWLFATIGYYISTLTSYYSTIRGWVEAVIGAFQWLYDVLVGHSIVPDLINAIVQWFVQLPGRILGGLQGFISSVISFFSGLYTSGTQIISRFVSSVVQFLSSLPGRAMSVLSGLPGNLGRILSDAGGRMRTAANNGVTNAVRLIGSLPGRAAGALGGIGSTLYRSGASLVSGFVRGIQSMIGAVQRAASSVASAARRYFPFSPAKEGPFSGRGWTLYSGRSLIEGFQEGIRDQLPALRKELTALPTGEVPGMQANVRGVWTAKPREDRIVFDVVGGDAEFKRMIRKWVRVDGRGNVQNAFG